MIKGLVDFLRLMGDEAPKETVEEAVGKLNEILEDVAYLLNHAFEENLALGNSRLPGHRSSPLTLEEALEILQTTLDIMQIEVESLLKDRPGLNERQDEAIRERRDFVIGMMGYYARFYKSSIRGRYPGAWTEEIEGRFSQFLKINPFGRMP
jgi:hypothetical protein